MWLKWTHRYDTSGPEVWTIVFIKNLSLNFTVEVLIEGDKESMHCQEMVTGFSKKNSFLLLLLFSRSVVSNSSRPHGLQHARLPCRPQLLELAQTYVHWVGDAIQQSLPLPSPSPPAFNLPQHQGLFQEVSSSHHVAKVLKFQLQHQSFRWIFRTGFL